MGAGRQPAKLTVQCHPGGIANTVKLVLSRPHIKRTPCINWAPASVPNFYSHIYCKMNLYSADTSIKWTRPPKWSRFVTQNLYWATTSSDFRMDIHCIVRRLCSFDIVFKSRCYLFLT